MLPSPFFPIWHAFEGLALVVLATAGYADGGSSAQMGRPPASRGDPLPIPTGTITRGTRLDGLLNEYVRQGA